MHNILDHQIGTVIVKIWWHRPIKESGIEYKIVIGISQPGTEPTQSGHDVQVELLEEGVLEQGRVPRLLQLAQHMVHILCPAQRVISISQHPIREGGREFCNEDLDLSIIWNPKIGQNLHCIGTGYHKNAG